MAKGKKPIKGSTPTGIRYDALKSMSRYPSPKDQNQKERRQVKRDLKRDQE